MPISPPDPSQSVSQFSHQKDQLPPPPSTTTHFSTTLNPRPSRTWLLTHGPSPLGILVAKSLLDLGDRVVLGCRAEEGLDYDESLGIGSEMKWLSDDEQNPRRQALREFLAHVEIEGKGDAVRVVGCDTSHINQCQSAIASTVAYFGRLDVLLCNHSEVFGTIEELNATPDARMLIRQQMKTNFFGPVNMIRAAIPIMRSQSGGHIMVVTGITSQLGTPGLPLFCAAGWGLEGFCDSLSYEIAPFAIKTTTIQPSAEITILPNRIHAAPPLDPYKTPPHPAPLARSIFGRILERLAPQEQACLTGETRSLIDPVLPPGFTKKLLAETVHAIVAIGGHENPPTRHIVGSEGMAAVKEKLKTMSEELEDFLGVSAGADVDDDNTDGDVKEDDGGVAIA